MFSLGSFRRAAASAVGALVFTSCTVSTDLSDAEKALLVTEADFGEYGFDDALPTGKFEKTRYFDRSVELTYESLESAEQLYVFCSVSIERSAADALTSEAANKTGVLVGLKSAGVIEKPVELKQTIGSRSKLSLLMKDGKFIGNSFHAIIDKKAVMLLVYGLYFENEAEFREFIDPKIEPIRTYRSSTVKT